MREHTPTMKGENKMEYTTSNFIWKTLNRIHDEELISRLSIALKQQSMLSDITEDEKGLYHDLWLLCDDWLTEEDVKRSAIPFRSL